MTTDSNLANTPLRLICSRDVIFPDSYRLVAIPVCDLDLFKYICFIALDFFKHAEISISHNPPPPDKYAKINQLQN
jgi:hypothetical protein